MNAKTLYEIPEKSNLKEVAKMDYKNILFDLDGTLTDPKVGITKSVQYALKKFDIHVDDLNQLEPFIGPPLASSFIDIFQFSDSDSKKAVEYYRACSISINIAERDTIIRDLGFQNWK